MGDQTLIGDNNNLVKRDDRLLEAASNGQTDLVLQLLEEEGQGLALKSGTPPPPPPQA